MPVTKTSNLVTGTITAEDRSHLNKVDHGQSQIQYSHVVFFKLHRYILSNLY